MLWHRKNRALGHGALTPLSPSFASHSSAGDFFMRRSSILAGVAVTTAHCILHRAQAQAPLNSRAGRRAGMPRRRQHRLHRRLGHPSGLRAARRGCARGPLCRDHPQGRPSISASPRNWRWRGAFGRRSPGSGRRPCGQLRRRTGQCFSSASGPGGNVLVGGSNNSIALQPLSLQGQVGLNVAAGLESLELRPGR